MGKEQAQQGMTDDDIKSRGYSAKFTQYLLQMNKKMDQDNDDKDLELLSVLKRTKNIYFDYSSDFDFEVKIHILELIVENCHDLRHLQKVEFDYVKTPDEMQTIFILNKKLMRKNFPVLIGVRVMSTIIKSESLHSVLKNSQKITKFFFTI